MPDDLVITEKTSQAKDVRAAVGARFGPVLPAEGHLLALLEPEEVVPAWKRWTPVLLRPDGLYGTKPATGGNKTAKLKAIRDALKGAKRVWLATDCDREGQLIGQEILEHCRYRGEVRRVMFTAQDPQTIREAFAAAKPNSEYARLYGAAVARQQADQVYNLSLTRTATVTLGRGGRGVVGVGRVKTPTLAIVCRRELEIRAFKPQAYFEVVATARVESGAFEMRHAPRDKILKRDAEAIAARADGFQGPIAVKVEDKRQAPPRLHDLPSLQKLCGSRFGWSAEKTLAVAQELYEGEGKKAITYPRAETRYLPESLVPDVPRVVAGLQAGQTFREVPVPAQPIVRRGKSGHFWDKGLEGASHHAVIPNANTMGDLPAIWPRLSSDERRLFVLIARSYLAALMPDFRYRQTTASLNVGDALFRAVGRQPIELGWKAAFGPEDEAEGEEGGQLLAAPQGRRSGAAPGAQGGGEGNQAAAPLQRGHPGRGDAERLEVRRRPGAAGAAEGGQGHRHAGDPGRDHQGAQAPGLPRRPRQAHRAHRARPGALRRAGAGRPGAGGPGRDGAAGVPAGRGPRGQAGDGSGDRRRLRPGRAHHRASGGERRWRRCRGAA